MIDKIVLTKYIIPPKLFWSKFFLLGFFILIGFACSLYMEPVSYTHLTLPTKA